MSQIISRNNVLALLKAAKTIKTVGWDSSIAEWSEGATVVGKNNNV